MRKTIEFEYEGIEYKLAFSAGTIKELDKSGTVNLQDLEKHLISNTSDLFCAAFNLNHRRTPVDKRMEIFHELCATDEGENTIEACIFEMLAEAITELTAHKGNIKWRMV